MDAPGSDSQPATTFEDAQQSIQALAGLIQACQDAFCGDDTDTAPKV